MLKPTIILRWLILLAGVMAAAPGWAEAAAARDALRSAQPTVRWQATTATLGDFTCDGYADTAMVGYGRRGEPWIGLVPGAEQPPAPTPRMLRFRLGTGRQDTLCATPVRIETRPLVCADRDSGPIPGCTPRPGCLALSMVDGRCDAVHFYWDADQQMLRWWRH
jgi:hypothetical protein